MIKGGEAYGARIDCRRWEIERLALCRRLKGISGGIEISQAEDGAEAVEMAAAGEKPGCNYGHRHAGVKRRGGGGQIHRMDAGCVIIFLTAYDRFS